MHIFVYAMGTGLGHVTRGLALSRAAARRGHTTTLLCNSPWMKEILAASCTRLLPLPSNMQLESLDAQLQPSDVIAQVQHQITSQPYDVLVVDTFARGLGGELKMLLASVPVPKVLIARNLAARYVQHADLFEFIRHYDLLIVPGEPSWIESANVDAVETAPWLIADANQCLPAQDARAFLNVTSDKPVVLVQSSGKPEETARWQETAQELHSQLGDCTQTVLATLADSAGSASQGEFVVPVVHAWPLLCICAAVDVVVAAGGYNTVQEARATRRPLVARPEKRMYDRQQKRLHSNEIARTNDDIVRKVRQLVEMRQTAAPIEWQPFDNGVHQAVRELEALAGG